ncbi:MAG: DNA replication and repair protein RecF [Rhodothermales bacterium]|nr:DNA replication and repair protein RecF [Rhodothermales bacterium]MBO6778855.1 DNA replication and repair protein RecF [Rhodothermales bacterium]
MQIRSLHIQGLRAHVDSHLAFSPGVNLIHGPNGAGKTNILEAVHYACLGKSFLASSDRYALTRGADRMQIDMEVDTERRSTEKVRLIYVPGEGKRVFVNGALLDRLVDVVGRFPVVVLAPSDHRLTEDGPDERRRFLDAMLCQASPAYLNALIAYRRVLKQRNELLSRRQHMRGEMMASYDDALVQHGSRLIARRARFVREFGEHLERAYQLMAESSEEPSIEYRGLSHLEDEPAVANVYRERLVARFDDACARGVTLTGPHRDDLIFRLDDMLVRRYASQGQHRTFVMGLKLAQYFYLEERLGERPLLLLDDVFDTLDPDRMATIARLLSGDAVGQSLVTSARADVFSEVLQFDGTRAAALAVKRYSSTESAETDETVP